MKHYTPHTFWNVDEGELRFITDVRPAGQLETYWETVFGLAQAGKVGANGLPNLPSSLPSPTNVPVPVTKLLVAVLGGIGRLLGYKVKYEKYSA